MENVDIPIDIGKVKCYSSLNCTFWCSDFTITKNFQTKLKMLKDSSPTELETLRKSFNILSTSTVI